MVEEPAAKPGGSEDGPGKPGGRVEGPGKPEVRVEEEPARPCEDEAPGRPG